MTTLTVYQIVRQRLDIAPATHEQLVDVVQEQLQLPLVMCAMGVNDAIAIGHDNQEISGPWDGIYHRVYEYDPAGV